MSLLFTIDKMVSWIGYSLDRLQNINTAGNTTLTGLSSGQHNITVYADEAYGNIGSSETTNLT